MTEHPMDTELRETAAGPGPNQTRALEQASRLRQRQQAKVDAIAADRDLLAAAKRRRIAEIADAFRDEITRLRAEHKRELEQQKARWERKAFGPASSTQTPAWRDATAQAMQLQDQGQAMDQAEAARRAADEIWLRGLASAAFQKGWSQVLAVCLADRPEVLEGLAEVRMMKDSERLMWDQAAFGTDLILPAIPDRGPAELAQERKETQAPHPMLNFRAISPGG